MVRPQGANKPLDIKFDGVGASVADGQEGVALLDMGEGGGHRFTMGRFRPNRQCRVQLCDPGHCTVRDNLILWIMPEGSLLPPAPPAHPQHPLGLPVELAGPFGPAFSFRA